MTRRVFYKVRKKTNATQSSDKQDLSSEETNTVVQLCFSDVSHTTAAGIECYVCHDCPIPFTATSANVFKFNNCTACQVGVSVCCILSSKKININRLIYFLKF